MNFNKIFHFFRMPFNWKTPISYIFAWIIQLVIGYYYCVTLVTILTLYFGFCCFFVDFTVDLTSTLHDVEKKIEMNVNRKGKSSSTAVLTDVKRDFYEYIRFYTDAKELSGIKFGVLIGSFL